MASRTVGFIYVLTNPAMPDMVKVGCVLAGRTTGLAEDLASELNTAAVPLPYAVEFGALTSFPDRVRARAHEMLGWQRVAPDREFFRVKPYLAVEAVRDALADEAGLAAWNSGRVHQVRDGDRIALTLREGDTFVVLAYPSESAERAVPVDLWHAHADGDVLELTATDPAQAARLGVGDVATGLDQASYLDGGEARPSGAVNGRERLVPGDRLLWVRPDTGAGAGAGAGAAGEGRAGLRTAFEFSSYCQAVSRTWDREFTPDGAPLIMAYPAAGQQPECVIQATNDALALPRPQAWAPRHPSPAGDWMAPVVTGEAPPEQLLTQLGKRRRSRATSAAANRFPPDQITLW